MKMDEALEWAADYVERNKLFETPLKSNGYPVDGWKPPSVTERVALITDLAKTVVESVDTKPVSITDVANVCPHGAILCAPCDYIPSAWKGFV